MPRSLRTARLLDGRTLAVDIDGAPPQGSISVTGVFHFRGTMIEMLVAPAKVATAVADDLGAISEGTFEAQGGSLSIGHVVRTNPDVGLLQDTRTAAWEGERYSLFTHLNDASRDDMVGLVSAFQLHEDAAGITAVPVVEGVEGPTQTSVDQDVPGVAVLTYMAAGERFGPARPAHAGKRVRGGELYQDAQQDGSPYFVLYSDGGSVTGMPLNPKAAASTADLLSDLDVRWS